MRRAATKADEIRADIRVSLTVVVYELNLLLKNAERAGLTVAVDMIERDGYAEVVLSVRGDT